MTYSNASKAHSEQRLKISFLPGVPENFTKIFKIQAAHFQPIVFTLMGEGVFPRIWLDLERANSADADFDRVILAVKKAIEQDNPDLVPTDQDLALEAERIMMSEISKKVPRGELLRVNRKSRSGSQISFLALRNDYVMKS